MSKHFKDFRHMALGYILIVGLSIGLITPIVQAEAPHDTSYTRSSTIAQSVDGLTQSERAAKIDAFYTERGNLPLAGYGLKMVQAADAYGVDWRLVAAIAYNESTAGAQECKPKNGVKTYNSFGYGGCKVTFTSYDHAIDTVTRNVAGLISSTKHYYAGKTLEQKIDAYNPPQYNHNYKRLVLYVMDKIANTETDSIASKAKTETKEVAMK